MDNDDKWFDNFIESTKRPIMVKNGVQDIAVNISLELVQYMITNRYQIVKVGKQTFQDFLMLMSNGQQLEAIRTVYQGLSTSDLIAQYHENAIKVEEIIKQEQERREFWFQMAMSLGQKLIPLALGSLL